MKSQKTPWPLVKSRVEAAHPDLEVTDGETTHRGNKSLITLRCRAKGHVTTSSIDSLLHKKRVKSCRACHGGRIGETIAAVVVHYLIGSTQNYAEVREVTPSYLKATATGGLGRLRHDAFFYKVFTDLDFDLALEHQGDQHINSQNLYHLMKKDPSKAFALAQARDKHKRKAAKRNGVVLVEIPDLAVHTRSRMCAVNLVIQLLKSKINVNRIKNFESRVQQLKKDDFVKELIKRCTAESTQEAKLRNQLAKEGNTAEILDHDPINGFFKLVCKIHKVTWQAHANNLIGSNETGRHGTRCPECGELVRREKRRLPFEELIVASAKKGFHPCFIKDAYVNNSDYLLWECLTCRAALKESWAHLSTDRKCRSCSGAIRQKELANRQMADIKEIVKHNGDRLISSVDDYQNQTTKLRLKCTREGGCGQEFEMGANKIKQGQLHSCDKHARRVVTRRGY